MTPKVLLMSDLHITEPGTHIVGLNPVCRFRRCLDHATLHHAEACHLFLMGDLTHHGTDAEYGILREILSSQPFPVTLMLGNHDRRGPFARIFPEHSDAFQQGHQDFGATRILYLDTLDEYAIIISPTNLEILGEEQVLETRFLSTVSDRSRNE